jgi:hypothetical protein
MTTSGPIADRCGRPKATDIVEKVAAWLVQFSCQKIDISDRPTNRSRTPVKGKKTPQNLPTEPASDFFNSIDPLPPVVQPTASAVFKGGAAIHPDTNI